MSKKARRRPSWKKIRSSLYKKEEKLRLRYYRNHLPYVKYWNVSFAQWRDKLLEYWNKVEWE